MNPMSEHCRLSIPMRLHHGAASDAHVTLTFRRTALMVELLDVPVRSHEAEQDLVTLTMRDVDARGLGLEPADFADGVAICHDGRSGAALATAGWACEPVLIVGVDDQGEGALIVDESDAARWLA